MQERLPFDPSRIRRPRSAPSGSSGGPATLSVRQVNELISGVLTTHLPPTLHILGEISNLSQPASGHVYFTLKDAASELRCVLWRSTAQRLRFAPEPGLEVIATGTIEVYAPRGTYQLIVRKLEPRGVGALEVAFRQLREKLEREGLFAPERKRPLPRIPERIAIVTSPTGAAIRDILHTLARRFPALEILVFPVRVQGTGAAEEIAAAIHALNQHADTLGGLDLAIVGRGGGSLEDLWAFNEEVVARAIAASRVPIVSAVGHEVDVSISDLVADLRAPTPTAAAELITPLMSDLLAQIDRARLRVARTVRHTLDLAGAELGTVLAYDGLARPLARLHAHGQWLDECQQRLRVALLESFRRRRERLNRLTVALLRVGTGRRFGQASRTLDQMLHRLGQTVGARVLHAERRLAQRVARVETLHPIERVRHRARHLEDQRERLALVLRGVLRRRREVLEARMQAVTACAPQQILKRGFSITRDARTRRVIRTVDQVRDKLRIVTELADGEFRATADDPKQLDLFE